MMDETSGEAMPAPDTSAPPPANDDGWEWAIVEIFGHRRHAGRVREEERFGAKMLRIDVPVKGDPVANGWKTHWYGGSSIFSLTLTDEASATRINTPYSPPGRYITQAPEEGVDFNVHGDDEPDGDTRDLDDGED